MAATKMTKNQMRRAKKKEQKKIEPNVCITPPIRIASSNNVYQGVSTPAENQDETPKDDAVPSAEDNNQSDNLEVKKDPDVDTKMEADGPALDDITEDDPAFAEYKRLLQDKNFTMSLDEDGATGDANGTGNKGEVFFDQDDEIPSEDEEAEPKMSKKKRKKLNKLSIAELKALVANPEVVEWQDVSSSDPRLLVQIKAQRNIVPVPTHWSLKREYLSSKRGIEKPPFKLPKFIAETGITEMRDAVLEKQAEQTLKQKQRERVQPKMGKLDIDYQRLYDAFFRHQTKPDLTRFGDVYYEGKEWEADYKIFKAGDLSDGLREALGMQPGFPPPWLLQQQRVGPPPSYPTLKIPGLNAPLPPGASWGFQPGQWGKPPLDEYNRPLYGGDIFGIMAGQPGYPGAQPTAGGAQPAAAAAAGYIPPLTEPIERTLWGELQPPAEESEEEDSEEEDEDEEDSDDDIPPGHGGTDTVSGLETPGGYASTINPGGDASGVETSMAGEFDLRKTRRGYETEESSHPRSAYTVIPERQTRVEGFFGSDKTYDLSHKPVLGQDDDTRKRKKPGDVDVAINPDELAGLSKDEIRRKYEQGRKEEGGMGTQWNKEGFEEDLTDMIAQESRKRQKRDEERRDARRGGGGRH
ncbi:putative spliceosome associated protein [Cladorrhinum sp. PSN259]|nr:putative spliceosome associated protein [Cladorrhinum sp. PSN259]